MYIGKHIVKRRVILTEKTNELDVIKARKTSISKYDYENINSKLITRVDTQQMFKLAHPTNLSTYILFIDF